MQGLADEAAALALIENLTISRNLDTALYALHQLEVGGRWPTCVPKVDC